MTNQEDVEKLAVDVAMSVLSKKFDDGKHLIFMPEGGCFRFLKTHWVPFKLNSLKKIIFDHIIESNIDLAHKAESLTNKACKFIELVCLQENGFIEPDLEIINLQNGELIITPDGNININNHSPSSRQLWCLGIEYNADAKAPLFLKTMSEIFAECDEPNEVTRHLLELFGYIISSTRHLPVVVMFVGPGSNGKTKLSQTLLKLLGPDSILCQSMNKMSSDGFFDAGLIGKALFLDDDLASGTVLPDGKLKALSEAKTLTARHPHGKSFTFTSKAVPMLLANHMPKTSDVSHGIRRRVHLFMFKKVFSGAIKDDGLFPKIWETEMSGILNLCLEGYQRLMERGDFLLPTEMIANVDTWLAEANVVPAFIENACIPDPDFLIKGSELYEGFKVWAKDCGYRSLPNRQKFYSHVEKLGFIKIKPQNAVSFRGLSLRISEE